MGTCVTSSAPVSNLQDKQLALTSIDNILVTRSLSPELYAGPIGVHFECMTLDNNSVCDLAEANGDLSKPTQTDDELLFCGYGTFSTTC